MIPPFNANGYLPPFQGPDSAHPDGSPYLIEPAHLIDRFATSRERVALLKGLFDYRAALVEAGISGLQWLDGSFCEDVERVRGRPPRDIDTTLFLIPPSRFSRPEWLGFIAANPQLFIPQRVKEEYGCEAYFVDVSAGPGNMLRQATYWFGLFSHRRETYEWKGLLAIEFPHPGDVKAMKTLEGMGETQ